MHFKNSVVFISVSAVQSAYITVGKFDTNTRNKNTASYAPHATKVQNTIHYISAEINLLKNYSY